VLGLVLVGATAGLVAGSADEHRAVAWHQVRPGGGTVCGRGAPFAFWAHLGSPERLLVYFDGGGFCWDYRSCAPAASLFKDQVTDMDDPGRHGTGILDLANPDNPFRGWSVLYVPSCSGDLFAGASARTYRSGDGRAVTIHHRGRVNATAALDWIFQRVPHPTQVVVAGCSAGSVGSVLHTPRIIERYPDARIAQIGDSLGYLLSEPTDLRAWQAHALLPQWIPAVRSLRPGTLTMPRLYGAVADHYPMSTFAQVNFRTDAVQRAYYQAAGGRAEDFDRALLGNLARIRDGTPTFRSCLLDGSDHCALSSGRFYELQSSGITLRNWVADLAAGRDVPNLPPT
jgi:hypothetical protein